MKKKNSKSRGVLSKKNNFDDTASQHNKDAAYEFVENFGGDIIFMYRQFRDSPAPLNEYVRALRRLELKGIKKIEAHANPFGFSFETKGGVHTVAVEVVRRTPFLDLRSRYF